MRVVHDCLVDYEYDLAWYRLLENGLCDMRRVGDNKGEAMQVLYRKDERGDGVGGRKRRKLFFCALFSVTGQRWYC